MKLTKSDKTKQKILYDKMVGPEPYIEPTRLDIQAKDLPDIKNWDIGKTYDIKLKAKMISKSEGGYDGKQPLKATFRVGNENDPNEDGEYDD